MHLCSNKHRWHKHKHDHTLPSNCVLNQQTTDMRPSSTNQADWGGTNGSFEGWTLKRSSWMWLLWQNFARRPPLTFHFLKLCRLELMNWTNIGRSMPKFWISPSQPTTHMPIDSAPQGSINNPIDLTKHLEPHQIKQEDIELDLPVPPPHCKRLRLKGRCHHPCTANPQDPPNHWATLTHLPAGSTTELNKTSFDTIMSQPSISSIDDSIVGATVRARASATEKPAAHEDWMDKPNPAKSLIWTLTPCSTLGWNAEIWRYFHLINSWGPSTWQGTLPATLCLLQQVWQSSQSHWQAWLQRQSMWFTRNEN